MTGFVTSTSAAMKAAHARICCKLSPPHLSRLAPLQLLHDQQNTALPT